MILIIMGGECKSGLLIINISLPGVKNYYAEMKD